ncbi:hypothetical protein [Nonomuraea sp. 10N515B]|uniref:hypothetical protein n=1 Tax=Nonomuraea sp. 10N515B TaxID=3457422 RepID=UPI003FCCDDE5
MSSIWGGLQAHSKLSGADHEILIALTDTAGGRQRFQDLAKTVDWERILDQLDTMSP